MSIKMFREKPGVISENECYVILSDEYMYEGDTSQECIWTMILQWKHDKHLVG